MANFITGGRDMFNAAVFGRVHQQTAEFFQGRQTSFFDSLAPAARAFHQEITSIYQGYDHAAATRLARAAVRKVRHLWDANVIRPYHTIDQFQHAAPVMQRWIMAEPTVRNLNMAQQCNGYAGDYVDADSRAKSGWQHYDYRRVTDGVFIDHDEGGMAATSYYEDLLPGDRDLDFEEKADVMETWNALRHYLKRRVEDPTDPFNGSL